MFSNFVAFSTLVAVLKYYKMVRSVTKFRKLFLVPLHFHLVCLIQEISRPITWKLLEVTPHLLSRHLFCLNSLVRFNCNLRGLTISFKTILQPPFSNKIKARQWNIGIWSISTNLWQNKFFSRFRTLELLSNIYFCLILFPENLEFKDLVNLEIFTFSPFK